MYTENKANEKIKNAAQGLFTVATYGIGMAIGSAMAGYISDYYTINDINKTIELDTELLYKNKKG